MWFYKSLLVLILANVTANVSADYFLSNDLTDWGLATCNLAEPKLSYISESFQVNETLGVHDNVSEFWIGYQQAKIPFLLLGCGTLNTETTYNVTNIGVCFNLCGGGPFAIKTIANTLECKCPNGSLPTYSQHCTPSANNICGETCYSIYDQLNVNNAYVTNPHSATEDCLTYYFPFFQWYPCVQVYAEAILVMCSNYPYEGETYTDPIYYHETSWVAGNSMCIKHDLFPASPLSIMKSHRSDMHSQRFWTGVIRASTLFKKSSIENHMLYEDIRYAFLTPNQVTVQFAATGNKRALCLPETETTSMSPSTSTIVSTNIETFDSKEDMQDNVHQSKTSNISFLAIGVGIGVPIGIIVAIGGGFAIGFLRKRGVLHCGKITSTEGPSNQRQEMNYEDTLDRNETNESYCVLNRNVDSRDGAVSYINPQTI